MPALDREWAPILRRDEAQRLTDRVLVDVDLIRMEVTSLTKLIMVTVAVFLAVSCVSLATALIALIVAR